MATSNSFFSQGFTQDAAVGRWESLHPGTRGTPSPLPSSSTPLMSCTWKLSQSAIWSVTLRPSVSKKLCIPAQICRRLSMTKTKCYHHSEWKFTTNNFQTWIYSTKRFGRTWHVHGILLTINWHRVRQTTNLTTINITGIQQLNKINKQDWSRKFQTINDA